MINDLTSPVERGPIIDVSQQGVNLSRASPLTRSGSGDGACVRCVALIDHSMPDFVVACEGHNCQYQLQSLMVCVVVLNDVPLLQCWSEDGGCEDQVCSESQDR